MRQSHAAFRVPQRDVLCGRIVRGVRRPHGQKAVHTFRCSPGRGGLLFSNLHIVIPLAGVLGLLVAALDLLVLQILAPGAMGQPVWIRAICSRSCSDGGV